MNTAQKPTVTFSFVVPVYNEQDGLEKFYHRLKAVAEALNESYEIVFVNDGSTDETADRLYRLSEEDTHVRAVEFSRNFGHQVAVTAGYDHAQGRAVISLDGDCQHPPEMIPQLVKKWREGYEVVYTVRKDTQGISRFRQAIGRLVYRVIAAISGSDLTDQADFRLLDRKAIDALKEHREHARFVRGLVRWIGFKQVAVPYTAEQRTEGVSNYSFRQLAQMAGAGIFNFSLKPLRLAGFLGSVLMAVSIIYFVISLALWPFGMAAGGMTHLWFFVTGMFGLQFMLLGILGEYVGRIFDETKDRPLYIVRDRIGFPDEPYACKEKSVSEIDPPRRYVVYT